MQKRAATKVLKLKCTSLPRRRLLPQCLSERRNKCVQSGIRGKCAFRKYQSEGWLLGVIEMFRVGWLRVPQPFIGAG